MTTINDIADIARILREQPEWNDTIRGILLSRELLELPEKFAEFAQSTSDRQDQLDNRLDEFIQATNRNFQLVYERLERLEVVVSDLNTRTGQVEIGVAALNTRMNRMEGKLDNAIGANYERKVAKVIHSLLGRLSLRRTKILRGYLVGVSQEFTDLVDDAEDNGLITEAQHNDIMQADLVCWGRNRYEGWEQYVAGEISVTIGDSDITRAVQRASILSAIVGQTVQPAVVGAYIDDERIALASAQGVVVLLSPED